MGANCCKGNTYLMAILACRPLMMWMKARACECVCVCLPPSESQFSWDAHADWSLWACRVRAASSHILGFCLSHPFSEHSSYFPSFLLSLPCVSKPCLLERLWISDELILRWIIVMVYSARVLLCCRCECRTVRSDLLWRPSEFASSIPCTCPHMAAETRARTLT